MPEDCGFCTAIRGGDLLVSGERASVLLDAHPINPGHLLLVPNRHAATLEGVDPEAAADLMRTARTASAALVRAGLAPAGVWLHLAQGAGQDEPHVHLHVIPRVDGDGLDLTESAGRVVPPLDHGVRERLRAAIAAEGA